VSIYKECDIRGTYGDDLTEAVAYRIGRAVGTRLPGRDIVVGGDVRTHTPALKKEAIRGLAESGATVLDIGIVPTPLAYFAQRRLGAYGVLMVTASHNAAQYNGCKLMLGDKPVTPEDVAEIGRIAEAGRFSSGLGKVESRDMAVEYEQWQAATFADVRGQGACVAVDAASGSYSEIAPRVLERLGFVVYRICCDIDGRFPHHLPNPAVDENVALLVAAMRERPSGLGIAFDGDGDRVVFVDELARIVSAERALLILARHRLGVGQRPGAAPRVVYDHKCSMVVGEKIREWGGEALPEKSGHAHIKRRMLEDGCLLGGEISGHFFHADLAGGDDGLYTALLMCRILQAAKLHLSALADTIPTYCITPDLRIPYDKPDRAQLLECVKRRFVDKPQVLLDGEIGRAHV
jgi:phosphomannomutase / phosphoglucomutase